MSQPRSTGSPLVVPQKAKPKPSENTKRQPPYHVILLNDDDHTYQYVIEMLMALFGHPPEKGYQMAREVDEHGRVIVLTTTREHAELKQEQIHAYGPDPYLGRPSAGSMTAVIEPAA
jgi:ATP-dependent Clp protease adaptor protein ClpS